MVIGYGALAFGLIVLVGAARASWPFLREVWREMRER